MAPEAANGGSPASGGMPGNGAVGHPKPAMNLAARAGRWSAQHRKAAILGWFGFVAVAVLAGLMVKQNQISDVDRFNGESHRAEHALDRSGSAAHPEVVFVQSPDLTMRIPSSVRRSRMPRAGSQRFNTWRTSGCPPATAVRHADRHAALVNFESPATP